MSAAILLSSSNMQLLALLHIIVFRDSVCLYPLVQVHLLLYYILQIYNICSFFPNLLI